MTLEQVRRDFFTEFEKAMWRVREGKDVTPFYDEYLNKLLEAYRNRVSERQIRISYNKWMHGFNVTNPQLDMSYLVGEVGEAMEALAQKESQEFVYELADIAIYCYGIAQMMGYDLDTAIAHKMQDFFGRNYQKDTSASSTDDSTT